MQPTVYIVSTLLCDVWVHVESPLIGDWDILADCGECAGICRVRAVPSSLGVEEELTDIGVQDGFVLIRFAQYFPEGVDDHGMAPCLIRSGGAARRRAHRDVHLVVDGPAHQPSLVLKRGVRGVIVSTADLHSSKRIRQSRRDSFGAAASSASLSLHEVGYCM